MRAGYALAESCFTSLNREAIGADLKLAGALPVSTLLFAETPSRIVISFSEERRESIAAIAQQHSVPLSILGKAGGKDLSIRVSGEPAIDQPVAELESAWRNSLSQKLEAQAMAAGRE